METQSSTEEKTKVLRLTVGGQSAFNWNHQESRKVIITMLDYICQMMKQKGGASKRRPSGAKAATTEVY